jgi:hypothetical protein
MQWAIQDFVLRKTASLLKMPAVYNAAKNNQLRVLLGLAGRQKAASFAK